MLRNGIKRIAALLKKKPAAQPQQVLPPIATKLLADALFDPNWYLTTYPDVATDPKYRQQPVLHFLELGGKQGLNPAPWFDSRWYLKQHKDVQQAGINPLVHYVQHGISEGRSRAEHILWCAALPQNQFIRVDEAGLTFTLPVFDNARSFNLSLLFQQYDRPLLNKPCGILLVQCVGQDGQAVTQGVTGLSWSPEFGCWYRYLVQKETERLDADNTRFSLPVEVKRCNFTIKAWNNCAFEVRNRLTLKPASASVTKVPGAPTTLSTKTAVTANQLKVALISDEFTYNSFKDEFNAIVLEPDSWRAQFEAAQPDIFFCESAWSGIDPKRRPWKGKIYASVNFARENRTILLEILAHCRQKGIPTLFWNKEDPTHYPDRKHDFVKTAALFDYVFTSAAECVAQYKQDYGLKHVFALPFATNPRLFNPLQSAERSNKVVFAGSWYANHIERSKVMEQILDSLISSGYEPEIYDRYYGDPDPLHIWPDKYLSYIKPGQPHDQMPTVYKSSQLGLNFNTVTESSTMFARRVFELMSSNTLVVSNYAKGVAEMFGDLVVFADKDPGRLGRLSEAERDLIREQALQLVLTEHTYAKRWRYMLQCIGFEVKPDNEDVTLVSRIASDNDAMASISYFEQHFGRNSSCRLLLVVSAKVPDIDVAAFYQQYNRFGITVTSESFMQKHALDGKYQPVETPYFMLFNPTNAPAAYWLEKARLHLSYQQQYPITPYSLQPYQLEAALADAPLLGLSQAFIDIYQQQCSGSILAYGV